MPYLVWDTVFDNSRVVAEMGRAPEPFSKYCYPLLRFSREHHFSYPYRPWPANAVLRSWRRPLWDRCEDLTAMMDLILEAWISSLIELTADALEILGAGRPWQAGRKIEAALRGLQRNAQYRLRCAR